MILDWNQIRKMSSVVASLIVTVIGSYVFAGELALGLERIFPGLLQNFGLTQDNIRTMLPICLAGFAILILVATLVHYLAWPIASKIIGSKNGLWVYVVQNIPPRTFGADVDDFESLYGMEKSRFFGYFHLRDSPFSVSIPRAEVYYYDFHSPVRASHRGSWMSHAVSLSGEHMRINYNIVVGEKLKGEQKSKYNGYYILEPERLKTPLLGSEAWHGVVFTLNEFGGMFGVVYAEKISRKHREELERHIGSVEEITPAFFKRLRLPEHVK